MFKLRIGLCDNRDEKKQGLGHCWELFFQNEPMHIAEQSPKGKVDRTGQQSLEHTMACNSILPNLPLLSSRLGSLQRQVIIVLAGKHGWYE